MEWKRSCGVCEDEVNVSQFAEHKSTTKMMMMAMKKMMMILGTLLNMGGPRGRLGA